MELVALLFVIAIWDVSKSAVRNARNGAPSASPAPARAAKGRPGRSAPSGVRQRQAGYWIREGLHGFPSARTGAHAGWLAHKAALAQQRNIREAARTNHIETERDTGASIREHRRRQAEALAEIEAELAAQQANGTPATGKSAVQSAADEVERKRKEREQATAPRCPGCHAPEGYDHRPGCDPSVPPLPADGVPRQQDDLAEHVKAPMPDPRLSSAQRQRDQRGQRNLCAACGHPGNPDDELVISDGYRVHESHTHDPASGFYEGPDGTRQQPPTTEGAAVMGDKRPGSLYSFRDEADLREWCRAHGRAIADVKAAYAAAGTPLFRRTSPSPTTQGAPVTASDPGFSSDPTGQRDDASSPARINNPGFTLNAGTRGSSVTDTNYDVVMETARRRADEAEQDAVAAAQRHQAAMAHAEDMQAVGVQGNTLSAQMELVDQLKHAEEAAKATGEQAAAVRDALAREHGGIHEAVANAPVARPAEMPFYRG